MISLAAQSLLSMKMMVITACCMAVVMSISFNVVDASDPPPLQDFCVGVNDTDFAVNGLFCKNPREVTSRDFVIRGFNTPSDTNNRFGSASAMFNVDRFPALNTLGLTMSRVDFAPGGLNPLHVHPRSSETVTVLQGTLYTGFITANSPGGDNRLFSAILKPGDLFVIPQGLVHFQLNIGTEDAVANAAFGSQNPGRFDVHQAVFGSTPHIPDVVLIRAFQVNESVIQALRAQFEDGMIKFDIDFDSEKLFNTLG